MHQSVSMVALIALSGCAATLDPAAAPPVSAVASGTSSVGAAPDETVIVKQVEIVPSRQAQGHCEGLTRPGSRIVVATRCRSIDEEALADQLNQVRREQDMLDRLARERENRRGGL